MDWPEFLESSNSHEPTFDMFNDDYWTVEEKQFFESAFAKYYNQDSETFFEFVTSKFPHKSMEDIKNHYLTLCQSIEMENNPPKNKDFVIVAAAATAEDDHDQQELPQEVLTLNGVSPPRVENNRPRRRRGIPWTEGEHQLFLMGLHRYGKGDWKSISRHYVVSKTPTQVASHAQKYFSRRNSKTPMQRRRASINDIQTVNLNPRTRPTSIVATTTHDQIINNAGRFAAYNNNHQAGLPFQNPLGDPTFSNNNDVNGNSGRFYGGEASGSNSLVMGQNNVNNNNINLPRPVSPRPFLSTYLSSMGF